jgi:hypothetical protein
VSEQWYERQQPGLGLRYVREVENCSRMILRFPLVAPEIDLGVRRELVPRFHYGNLYRVHGEIIYVLAVMHLHRHPGYWQGR